MTAERHREAIDRALWSLVSGAERKTVLRDLVAEVEREAAHEALAVGHATGVAQAYRLVAESPWVPSMLQRKLLEMAEQQDAKAAEPEPVGGPSGLTAEQLPKERRVATSQTTGSISVRTVPSDPYCEPDERGHVSCPTCRADEREPTGERPARSEPVLRRAIIDVLCGADVSRLRTALNESREPDEHPEDRCEECRASFEPWTAAPEDWRRVTGRDHGGPILCQPCFERRLANAGERPAEDRTEADPAGVELFVLSWSPKRYGFRGATGATYSWQSGKAFDTATDARLAAWAHFDSHPAVAQLAEAREQMACLEDLQRVRLGALQRDLAEARRERDEAREMSKEYRNAIGRERKAAAEQARAETLAACIRWLEACHGSTQGAAQLLREDARTFAEDIRINGADALARLLADAEARALERVADECERPGRDNNERITVAMIRERAQQARTKGEP